MPAAPAPTGPIAPESAQRLRAFAARWKDAGPAERANYAMFLAELTEALGVERPRPAPRADRVHEDSAYQFEYPVKAVARDGTIRQNFIDLYKAGCFALEAKAVEEGGTTPRVLTAAYGQVSNYARDLPERPPYILVVDVPRTMLLWDRWAGSYGGFNAARRIDLLALADRPDDAALLRDVFTDPSRRDPRRHAQAVTEEIAGLLAELAASLERRGHAPEDVARFLIRCVFTMFAEDVHLLPDASFRQLLEGVLPRGAPAFAQAAESLWRAMDTGGLFGWHSILRFNGHFFRESDGTPARALPLDRDDVALLIRAARADWSAVEPSIFGTLLVRALTPEERHRLGAEYTPRAFIERLVRPTVEEPVRERWAAVQAEVLQLRERGRPVDLRTAEARLVEFHDWLLSLRVLDPACGSGNFLYVTMHALKRVEVEVFRLLAELRGGQLGMRLREIDPGQFHGIEVKAWAREIAELTLWIGFHQFWRQEHADVQPEEPLLRDTGTLELRDAVLAWDEIRRDPSRDRPDPAPRVRHPVTGQLVPDPAARLPYYEYVGARQAEWPEAEFIVGNPPYMGQFKQREAFGDGHVDALRAAYPELPDTADFVVYWWFRAATAVARGTAVRAGLITTNSITQTQNRSVIARMATAGARVMWAIPDHPWVDAADGADVRVAMTVLAREPAHAVRIVVDDAGQVLQEEGCDRLNADLTAHADTVTAAATPLRANLALACPGFKLDGAGFILSDEEAHQLLRSDPRHAEILKRYLNGRDLSSRPRGVWLIDFGLRDEADARSFPVLFDLVRDRVRPERAAKPDRVRREYWWRLGRPREQLRHALTGLTRYLATSETSKHGYFTFLNSDIAPDNKLIVIAASDAAILGVLSSTIHRTWSLAVGGRLGVGNDPVYVKSSCFDAFPFPDPLPALRARVADVAERLDAHRKAALARDERVTMTGMYNVVEKLRANEPLTPKERAVHELAACGVLRDLHDELDRLVAEAYGWPWPLGREEILERLVALHDERVAEEARGIVRWLRPEYQARGGTVQGVADLPDEPRPGPTGTPTAGETAAPAPWPAEAVEQIAALKRLAAARPVTPEEATRHFAGAPSRIVERHLDTLAILGELRVGDAGRYTVPSPG